MTWRPLPDDDAPGAPVKQSIDRLVKKLGMPSTDAMGTVFRHWPDVVGQQVAEHSRPVTLRDGVLRVAVDDSQWLTQLKWAGPKVVERLRAIAPEAGVHKLEFRRE